MDNRKLQIAVSNIMELDARTQGISDDHLKAKFALASAAPSMAKLIAQLWEEREELRERLVKAREALVEGKHYTFLREDFQDESNFPELADEAISLLDGLLKEGE